LKTSRPRPFPQNEPSAEVLQSRSSQSRPKQQERRPQVQNQQPDAPAHVDGDEPKKAHVRVKGEQIIW